MTKNAKKSKALAMKAEPTKSELSKPAPRRMETLKLEPTPVKAAPTRMEAAPKPPILAQAPTPPKPAASASFISLELVKPDAKHVYVAGSFNEWKPERAPLMAAGNGRWVGNLNVKPGRYEYLFVVDGQWLPDPNAKETVQNPFGGKNSVMTVSV